MDIFSSVFIIMGTLKISIFHLIALLLSAPFGCPRAAFFSRASNCLFVIVFVFFLSAVGQFGITLSACIKLLTLNIEAQMFFKFS